MIKLFLKEISAGIFRKRKVIESLNLGKLVFRSVKNFQRKSEQKIFRPECFFILKAITSSKLFTSNNCVFGKDALRCVLGKVILRLFFNAAKQSTRCCGQAGQKTCKQNPEIALR